MWGLEKGISHLPARIIDGGGGTVATVPTGTEERVTLPKEGRETFFQDGPNAIIEGTPAGFNLYQLNKEGERSAIQRVGPGEHFKAVTLVNGRTAEGVTLV